MATTDASRSLIKAPVGKTLWEMTWPVIFGVATLISFNVVDTFFETKGETHRKASLPTG